MSWVASASRGRFAIFVLMEGAFHHFIVSNFSRESLIISGKGGGREAGRRRNGGKFSLIERCLVHIFLIILCQID